MNKTLQSAVIQCLHRHCDVDRPLLIGLSGGPDSLALLHVVHQYRKNIGVAHVDHGWREESAQEAIQLQALAESLGIPFHLKKLHPKELEGNLEAACRLERLKFFKHLCDEHGYQAVMLGHHADDQAETVLKRVFEGVSIPYLSSLQNRMDFNGLILLRPFLFVRKSQIMDYIEANQLKPFEDRTNQDPRFLRGKFRTTIIPFLSELFGKQMTDNLCHIGAEAGELRQYLDERIAPFIKYVQIGKMGALLDLSKERPESPYELKYLIRRVCETQQFSLPRDLLELAVTSIWDKVADVRMFLGERLIVLDRGCLFIPKNPGLTLPEGRIPLTLGVHTYGPWKISVMPEKAGKQRASHWQQLWMGEVEAVVPAQDYLLGAPQMKASFRGTSPISKWWTNAKVPAFMRAMVPVLWEEDKISWEFLSGKLKPTEDKCHGQLRIKLAVESE